MNALSFLKLTYYYFLTQNLFPPDGYGHLCVSLHCTAVCGSNKHGPHLHTGQPLPHAGESELRRDVVHNHHAVGLAEELLGDAAVPAGGGGANSR